MWAQTFGAQITTAITAALTVGDASPRSREELLRHIRDGWGTSVSVPVSPTLLIALGLVLAAGAAGVMGVRLWRQRADGRRAGATFRLAARRAGLSWRDRWALRRIAARAELPTPLTLLLSPATLRHHAAAVAQRSRSPRLIQHMARVEAMLLSLHHDAMSADEEVGTTNEHR